MSYEFDEQTSCPACGRDIEVKVLVDVVDVDISSSSRSYFEVEEDVPPENEYDRMFSEFCVKLKKSYTLQDLDKIFIERRGMLYRRDK